MGDGRAEGSSAIRDGGQAAISLMSDVDGMYVRIFESLQLEGSHVEDLLYSNQPWKIALMSPSGARDGFAYRLGTER